MPESVELFRYSDKIINCFYTIGLMRKKTTRLAGSRTRITRKKT